MVEMLSGDSCRAQLERVVEELALETDDVQKKQLLLYVQLLIKGLEKQRLVGERNAGRLIGKQLFDSLYPLKIWRISPGSLLDLGTGAGLPGIPLKICLPGQRLYLLDSNRRKINFLRRVGAELGLREVFYLPGRAEEWGRDPCYRERFDCVVCRAVARAAVLAELGLPLTKMGGSMIIYKGSQGDEEMGEAAVSLRLCGGRLEQSRHYRLPTGEKRTLYLIKKIKPAPADYPRRPGLPTRKPLGD